MLIKENQSILIPIDFSKQSLVSIQQTYNLAKFTNSKIILLHAFSGNEVDRKEELEQLAAQTSKESGLVVEALSVKGDIYEQTDAKAKELFCGLIIVGLDTQVRFRSFFGGNNVSKFLKNAPCPVITMRSTDNRNSCKNIVMPFDLTPESREKVPIVVQLAHYYGADIRIVSVFSPNDEKYENLILPYLNQVKKYIKEKGINCTNKSIPSNNVAESVVEYANKVDGDLIIQMNKRDLSFGEMFGGATSHKIVEISNIPVLSINPMIRESISSGIH
jgi:nucleotide-binding universal stress UspA family protein